VSTAATQIAPPTAPDPGDWKTALLELLRVLRSRDLSDSAARSLALASVTRLLADSTPAAAASKDNAPRQTSALALDALRAQLRELQLTQQLRIDYVLDPRSTTTVPTRAATTARRWTTHAITLLCNQMRVSRFHITWYIGATQIVISIRDDGPGELDGQWLHNEIDLGGLPRPHQLDVRCIPRWGTEIAMTHVIGTHSLARSHLPHGHPLTTLNTRERDVLNIVARGEKNKAIAEQLGISENTVRFHVTNILKKLDVGSRQEATAKLFEELH